MSEIRKNMCQKNSDVANATISKQKQGELTVGVAENNSFSRSPWKKKIKTDGLEIMKASPYITLHSHG